MSTKDPATRADLERALRNINADQVDARDALLQLAAHVVVLTDELARRIAAPDLGDAIAAQLPAQLEAIRAQASTGVQRPDLEPKNDKYEVVAEAPPCLELIPICGARCCALRFPLSTQDLDEGVIRWDYGKPYQIRQRETDGRCVHNEVGTGHCTVHANRPRICRTYHCKDDKRIWIDYEKRIPAPLDAIHAPLPGPPAKFDLIERLRERRLAHELERETLDETFAE